MHSKQASLAAAALAALTLLAGCGEGGEAPNSAVASPDDTTTAIAERHVEVSLVKTYGSIPELVSDSALVVKVEATAGQKVVGATQDGSDPAMTATLTTVRVLETYAGTSPATLTVRQSGSEKTVFDGLGALLVPGEQYLLYLTPFTFDLKAQGTGDWTPTGAVGVYHSEDGNYVRTASDAADLPKTVDAVNPLGR